MADPTVEWGDLRAPFPWFGGKSRVASLVWERLGDVPNYVEPFAGSLAVLLGRPHAPKTETVNDRDAFLANFWRAVQSDPDAVARWADWPVNETDLQARHLWLVNHGREIVARLGAEPNFYDARVAGWWVWGLCQWIGDGWCSGRGPHRLSGMREGVSRKLPALGDAGRGVHRPDTSLVAYMRALAVRFRYVRVACGDWARVVGPSVTTKNGCTGLLLDPPYDDDEHAMQYAARARGVASAVSVWALENGDNPLLRIALCGYASNKDAERLVSAGWSEVSWKTKGGYGSQGDGRGRDNATRERIWFSPHCLDPVVAQSPMF